MGLTSELVPSKREQNWDNARSVALRVSKRLLNSSRVCSKAILARTMLWCIRFQRQAIYYDFLITCQMYIRRYVIKRLIGTICYESIKHCLSFETWIKTSDSFTIALTRLKNCCRYTSAWTTLSATEFMYFRRSTKDAMFKMSCAIKLDKAHWLLLNMLIEARCESFLLQ